MKASLIASTFAAFAIISIGLLANANNAQAQPSSLSVSSSVAFSCQEIGKIPSTVARVNKQTFSTRMGRAGRSPSVETGSTSETQVIPVLKWKRPEYPETKENPLERCIRVSGILQDYNYKGLLNYIKVGEMDGKQAVCAANGANSPCSLLIFTLEKDDNPEQVIQDLLKILKEPTILPSLNSTNSSSTEPAVVERWTGGGGGGGGWDETAPASGRSSGGR